MSFHQGNIWVSMLRWNMEDEQLVQSEASQPALEPGGEGLARFKIPNFASWVAPVPGGGSFVDDLKTLEAVFSAPLLRHSGGK
jgi:hypothetical protein